MDQTMREAFLSELTKIAEDQTPAASLGGGMLGAGAGLAGGHALGNKLFPHTGSGLTTIGGGLLGASLGSGLAGRVAGLVHKKDEKSHKKK